MRGSKMMGTSPSCTDTDKDWNDHICGAFSGQAPYHISLYRKLKASLNGE